MAIILRGNRKGEEVSIVQFCNDWILVDCVGKCKLYNPTSIKLTEEEAISMKESSISSGFFFTLFEIGKDFRIRKKKMTRFKLPSQGSWKNGEDS